MGLYVPFAVTEKKRFFAQTSPGEGHQSGYFDTLDKARVWIEKSGGGSIKMRDAGTIHSTGSGSGKVVFDPPLKVWRTIETWPTKEMKKGVEAVSPLQQTFLDIRGDTQLSGHDLGQFELVETQGPHLFWAYRQACGRFVEVTQKGVIYSLLGEGRCRG